MGAALPSTAALFFWRRQEQGQLENPGTDASNSSQPTKRSLVLGKPELAFHGHLAPQEMSAVRSAGELDYANHLFELSSELTHEMPTIGLTEMDFDCV